VVGPFSWHGVYDSPDVDHWREPMVSRVFRL
jgi:hypothetical protein